MLRTKKKQISIPPLYGLVACGGKSLRMGFDKSMITYHKVAQRYHVYHLLQPFCERIFFSCNREQASSILPGYDAIVDSKRTYNQGPIAGLLSAFNEFSKVSFLMLGCDYPLLQSEDVEKLVAARNPDVAAICYLNASGIEEPLLAIYEMSIQKQLNEEFNKGNYSLRSLLQRVNVFYCSPISEISITSIDERKAFDELGKSARSF